MNNNLNNPTIPTGVIVIGKYSIAAHHIIFIHYDGNNQICIKLMDGTQLVSSFDEDDTAKKVYDVQRERWNTILQK